VTLKFAFTVVLLFAASGCAMSGSTTATKPLDGSYYGRTTVPLAMF
jgi:hypothetical protein